VTTMVRDDQAEHLLAEIRAFGEDRRSRRGPIPRWVTANPAKTLEMAEYSFTWPEGVDNAQPLLVLSGQVVVRTNENYSEVELPPTEVALTIGNA